MSYYDDLIKGSATVVNSHNVTFELTAFEQKIICLALEKYISYIDCNSELFAEADDAHDCCLTIVDNFTFDMKAD